MLREAREAAGLTLEQVSRRTRLRVALLQDLERGDTAGIGAAVYVRGHLKAVARATGTDPEPLLDGYARQAGTGQAPFGTGQPPFGTGQAPFGTGQAPLGVCADGGRPIVPADALRGRPADLRHLPTAGAAPVRGPRWAVPAVAAVAVLAVLVVVGTLTGAGEGQDMLVATPSDSLPSAATPSAGAGLAVPDPPPATPVGPPAASLSVSVAGGPSWVRVAVVGGATLFEGVLQPGEVQDFRDPAGLAIVVGNAGAVTLSCDGGPAAAAGPEGAVRRFTCATSGLSPV